MNTDAAKLPGRLATSTKAGFGVGQVAGQLFRDAPSLLLMLRTAEQYSTTLAAG
ncbi:MAG: hypothetical protein VYD90_08585 [Pseudomonadota bacterium]|nr:hypothetical protein [Pseudomonadota bacterium]